jgi:hypothetical protein
MSSASASLVQHLSRSGRLLATHWLKTGGTDEIKQVVFALSVRNYLIAKLAAPGAPWRDRLKTVGAATCGS